MPRGKLKNVIISVPIIGYLARLGSNIVRLPKRHDQLVRIQDQTNNLLLTLQKTQQETDKRLDKLLANQISQLAKDIKDIRLTQDNLQGQFSLLETSHNAEPESDSTQLTGNKELFAKDHIMDNFYTSFEDRFRGTESLISKRLEEYLPYFTNSRVNFNETPVLDIGSGRGEFLQLLKTNKISAIGLDINHSMVEKSKKKSLKVVQSEALSYLQATSSQSYGAVTGFHIVEHVPFNSLFRIFQCSYRALIKGGFVIFETPNPENLIVGSNTFYLDPSHLHPLPPTLLAFTLETCGFKNVEIKRLHPNTNKMLDDLDPEVANLLFGSRDYAVIGYK